MKDFLILNSVASRLNFLGFASTMRGSKSQGKAMSLPQASQTHSVRPQTLSQASSQVCPRLLQDNLALIVLRPALPTAVGGSCASGWRPTGLTGSTMKPCWLTTAGLGSSRCRPAPPIYSFLTPDHLSHDSFF